MTAHNSAAAVDQANLGTDLWDFDGATEVRPEINLPSGITAPDQNREEERQNARKSVAPGIEMNPIQDVTELLAMYHILVEFRWNKVSSSGYRRARRRRRQQGSCSK